MINTALRSNLVQQADTAMMTLMKHINIMLNAAHTYGVRNPEVSLTDTMKHRELKQAITDMGSIPKMLVGEIGRWKKEEDRILSRRGMEDFLLNELYATLESLLWFYEREQIEVPEFSLSEVRAAHSELVRCNRLL